jgi:hypothetical protein
MHYYIIEHRKLVLLPCHLPFPTVTGGWDMRKGIGLGWREEKVYQQIHNYKLLIYKGNQNISIKIWV